MTPIRRLAACAVATVLLGTLSACGADNPFGRILTGSGSTTPTSASTTPGASPSETTGESPSESATDSPSSDASGTSTSPETMTGTSTSSLSPTAPPATPAPGASDATTTSTDGGSASPSTSSDATQQGSVVQIDGRTIRGVPVGLAFPDGAKIEGNSEFAGGGGTVVLSAPAENQLFTYYRSALPGSGYRIVSDTAGVLAFTGHGFRGTIVGTGTGGVLTWSPMQH